MNPTPIVHRRARALLATMLAAVQITVYRLIAGPRDERGEIEQVTILKGLFAAAALAIGAIIVAKFTGAANNIPTGP